MQQDIAPFSAIMYLRLTSLSDSFFVEAIDVAVERGFNHFAEHLNNLLYSTDDGRRGECDEEKDEPFVSQTSIDDVSTEESVDDSGNDSGEEEEYYESSEIAYEIGNEAMRSQRTHELESRIDDTIQEYQRQRRDLLSQSADDSDNDVAEAEEEYYAHMNQHADVDCTNTVALMEQLSRMTSLAQTQSRELYQAKFSLSELMKEHNNMKMELGIFHGDDTSDDKGECSLSQKSLAELTCLEEKTRRALDRIVKAKEIASSNLEEERVCVICRENLKCVLLMNCRHLCVCKDCGHHDALVQCPLCRETITERINVFS